MTKFHRFYCEDSPGISTKGATLVEGATLQLFEDVLLTPEKLKSEAPGGTSLVVQPLRLRAPTAGSQGSIPGQGTRSRMPQLKIPHDGASLVAQWLRICLPMQGTRVRALVWEDPTCRGPTGPVSHNY